MGVSNPSKLFKNLTSGRQFFHVIGDLGPNLTKHSLKFYLPNQVI
ncbi:hypothetical protein COLO4_34210 [Corchorus olitorius]|uniref:Uncharacterized protein n=1 Tax=Corchorus olitorius TaxID=93759 RepID=A0A1R3GMX7_9ROSI|nr:hypothetical protein COLO4_34210 [Corchorus olitorius]